MLTFYALLDVTCLIYSAIQHNKQTASLPMDFKKTFDTCSHKFLCLVKLYRYDIRGSCLWSIKSYITSQNLIKATNAKGAACLTV